jgi:hypothetical protein
MENTGRRLLHRREDRHNEPLEHTRQQFLEVYGEQAPELIQDLICIQLGEFASVPQGRHPDAWDILLNSEAHPVLRDSLESWARKFHLTQGGKPAGWAMDAALTTLRSRSDATKFPGKFRWTFPFRLHQEYPSGDPGLEGASTGLAEPDVFSVSIEIPSRDRPGGESIGDFRKRFNAVCKQKRENHIAQIKSQNWTSREKVTRPEYILGLAKWQSGLGLSEIQRQLADKGFHVGRQGGADTDVTALQRGIDRVAAFIGIDCR